MRMEREIEAFNDAAQSEKIAIAGFRIWTNGSGELFLDTGKDSKVYRMKSERSDGANALHIALDRPVLRMWRYGALDGILL